MTDYRVTQYDYNEYSFNIDGVLAGYSKNAPIERAYSDLLDDVLSRHGYGGEFRAALRDSNLTTVMTMNEATAINLRLRWYYDRSKGWMARAADNKFYDNPYIAKPELITERAKSLGSGKEAVEGLFERLCDGTRPWGEYAYLDLDWEQVFFETTQYIKDPDNFLFLFIYKRTVFWTFSKDGDVRSGVGMRALIGDEDD